MPFTWSEDQQAYYYPSGRRVPAAVIDRALDRVIQAGANNMRALTEQLQAGAITLSAWQSGMADELKMLHTGAAALGRGGWAQMTWADWGATGPPIKQQYVYLRQFAEQIATGHVPMDGRLIARAAMYAQAARSTHRGMQARMARTMGREQERNMLGAADRHCSQCVGCSAQGWVSIGTLPPPGTRICMSACKCRLAYREAPSLHQAVA